MAHKYVVIAPATPGAKPSWVGGADTLEGARDEAAEFCRGRTELRGQDVRIEEGESRRLVEYAGPCR